MKEYSLQDILALAKDTNRKFRPTVECCPDWGDDKVYATLRTVWVEWLEWRWVFVDELETSIKEEDGISIINPPFEGVDIGEKLDKIIDLLEDTLINHKQNTGDMY